MIQSSNLNPVKGSVVGYEIQKSDYPQSRESNQTNPALIDIFPINNGQLAASDLPSILKNYLNILTLSQEAIARFERGEMPLFDPLVGEHACQIRAAMFAELLNNEGTNERLAFAKKLLEVHTLRIKTLLENKSFPFRYVESFKLFLKHNNALLEFPEEILVIISSYILTETKIIDYKLNDLGVPVRQERILAKTLSERKGLVPNFANSIIKTTQEKLSIFSVNYVQRIALRLGLGKDEQGIAKLVSGKNIRLDERHRQMTPCHPTMRLLLSELHKNKIPLVLKIEQFIKWSAISYGMLFYVFGIQDRDYSLLKKSSMLSQRGAVFFHTKSITEKMIDSEAVEKKVLEHKVSDLILSSLADHPPYGNKGDDGPEDPERDKDRLLALKLGTSRSEPSFFMMEHICCDYIEIDSKGMLVQTVWISSKQKVEELYDKVAEIGGFCRHRLRLLSESKSVPTATFINNELVDLTINETFLKNNSTLYAIEFQQTPLHRKYPDSKFKLKIREHY